MAESVISLAIERIADLLIHEAFFLDDVKEEVESLKTELERMKSFLKDVDRKQEHDERLRTRVKEIRNLAYDAEDIIDSYILKVSHRGGFHGIIKRFTTIFTKPSHLHRIGKQVKAIQTKLGDISRSLPAYGISGDQGADGSNSAAEMQRRLRRSYPHDVEEDDVVSLEVSTRDVLDQLMKEDQEIQDRLHIVSLVGMGGIGKTTLAKKVYNQNVVKRHFDCCAWIFISQQCLPREVFHGILIKVLSPSRKQRELIDRLKEDELVEMVYDVLKQKRYLVVLDDIWRCEDWDSLKPAFPKGNKGSKLLFTTRNKEVALLADPCSSPIELPLLTDDESWKLFRRKTQAFSSEFEMLGKEMLKKCGGLPLAIVVLGGLLATKKSLNEWEMVQRNIKAHLNKFQQRDSGYNYGGVNWILALSYNELPFCLKPCFLYLGHYPEDWEISKKELVRLWIAEGFISASFEGDEMLIEDVAEQYLEELINRCLVQVGKRDHTGTGVKTCRIHDLLRDLCVIKSQEENFLRIIQPSPLIENDARSSLDLTLTTASMAGARRIAVHPSKRYVCLKGKAGKHSNLRSLLIFQNEELIKLHISKCNRFKLLRVLNLVRNNVSNWHVSKEIGNLHHLRYLGLKSSLKIILPSSIGKIKSLQTIKIQSYSVRIPKVLFMLERLRHILLLNSEGGWEGRKLCLPPPGDSPKTIETLKYVQFDENLIKNNAIVSLINIQNLGISFKRSKDVEAFLKSQIKLQRLRSLHMVFDNSISISYPDLELLSQSHSLSKLFLKGKIQLQEDPHLNSTHHVLRFLPPNIVKLTLWVSEMKQDPMVVLEKMPHLRILNLQYRSYMGTHLLCSSNGFLKLDYLYIEGLYKLEEWEIEEGAMPCLKSLHLSGLSNLKKFPEGLKYITALQEMSLYRMKRSLLERIQVIDGRQGEDFFKVQQIPSIQIIG